MVNLGALTQQVSQRQLPTPPVNAPLEFREFHMQALFLGGGNLELSAPSHTVLVP